MKKIAIIVLTVAALIGVTVYADRATRLSTTHKVALRADAQEKPAPEIRLKDLNGKEVSLADYKGQVVLLNFWATWCDPCRVEIPWLIDLQAKYASRGFTVVGVAMDEEGKSVVAPFIEKERFDVNGKQLPMDYPILLGDDEASEKFGGILGYPTSFLISRDGKQVMKIQGLRSYDEIAKAIEDQLDKAHQNAL
jgi:cytochrome c biogenesis protein CcmG/thiol:disulfide interchange protein DsbE